MKKDKSNKSGATTLQHTLSVLLVIVVLGAIAGFYAGLQMIKDYSLEVTHTTADANASGKNIEELGALKQQLADGKVLVEKANKLFSTPETYQTQALKDISKYADATGVKIASIDSTTGATGAVGAEHSEVITLQNPVSYTSFLKFIDAIEGNLPKMQITGITIGRTANGAAGQITTGKITIAVSTR